MNKVVINLIADLKEATKARAHHSSKEISALIRNRMQDEAMPGDAPLPSERELSRIFSVTHVTARRALQTLVDENIIYRVPGKGTFVTGRFEKTHRAAVRYESIGVMMPSYGKNVPLSARWSPVHFQALMGMESCLARESGRYLMSLIPTPWETAWTPEKFRALPVSGVILLYPYRQDRELLETCRASGKALVVVNCFLPDLTGFDLVNIDKAGTARQAFGNLAALGRRRIACCDFERKGEDAPYLDGYRQAAKACGRKSRETLFSEKKGPHPEFYENLVRWADAVMVNDMEAESLYAAAERVGKKIPDDLAVIGLYDMEKNQALRPEISSFAVPVEELGATAAARLCERLANPGLSTGTILVPQPYLARGSCR